MSAENPTFEDISIARDLVRKPEVRMLALCLYRIGTTEPVVKDNIPPIYVRMAYRMLKEPKHMDDINRVLEIVS
jgi:hypothetical protein